MISFRIESVNYPEFLMGVFHFSHYQRFSVHPQKEWDIAVLPLLWHWKCPGRKAKGRCEFLLSSFCHCKGVFYDGIGQGCLDTWERRFPALLKAMFTSLACLTPEEAHSKKQTKTNIALFQFIHVGTEKCSLAIHMAWQRSVGRKCKASKSNVSLLRWWPFADLYRFFW